MNWIHYLLEANLYLVAFYLLYALLFRSQTHYQLNRGYLLFTSALAFVIPLLQLGVLKPELEPVISIGLPTPMHSYNLPLPTTASPAPSVYHWQATDYALAFYGLVTVTLFAYLIFKIGRLLVLAKRGTITYQDGFKVVEIPGENVAFSFFGYLFIDNKLSASATIIHHEQVHIRQKHSVDIMYIELLKIFNWFNPAVYLLQKSMKEVHEFIADQQAAALENNAASYADFLISNAYGLPQNQLTNSFFNNNLLKRRIIMLYHKKSGRAARMAYLLTLPLAGGLICLSTIGFTTKTYGWIDIAPKHIVAAATKALHATPDADTTGDYKRGWDDAQHDMAQQQQANDIVKTLTPVHHKLGTNKDSVYNAVDVNPEFPGNIKGFEDFLKKNIKYPQEAKEAKISGRAFIQFIVEADGSISNVKIVRNPGHGFGEEALRVIQLSPKWAPGTVSGKPVRVLYTVPVNFSLDPNAGATNPNKAVLLKQLEAKQNDLLKNRDSVYNSADVNPQFPGGDVGFATFLQKNVRYPRDAKENKIQGRVFASFIVEADGSLTDIKILREPGSGLGEESIRVLKLSPIWTPGKINGAPIRVKYTVPINFSLNNSDAHDINGLYAYIKNTIKYPAEAKDKNTEGRVFVSFTVNNDKAIENIKVLRTPDKSIGDEVLRVVQNFKTLSVGKTGYTYVLPVNLSIQSGKANDVTLQAPPKPDDHEYQPEPGKTSILLYEVVVFGYK